MSTRLWWNGLRPRLFQEVDEVLMGNAFEVFLGITATLEDGSKLLQVGDYVEPRGGLLGSETTIEIGADTGMPGSAEQLTNMIDVVCDGLDGNFGFVCVGGYTSLPAGDNHPSVEGNTDDGTPISQSLDLLIGELARIVRKSPTIVVTGPDGTLEKIESLPEGLVAQVGDVEDESQPVHLTQ